jgi:tight adherence protein C
LSAGILSGALPRIWIFKKGGVKLVYVISFLYFASIIFIGLYAIEKRRLAYLAFAERVGAALLDPLEQPSLSRQNPLLLTLERLRLRFGRYLPWLAVEEYNRKLSWAGAPLNLKGEELYLLKVILGVLPPLVIPAIALLGGGPTTAFLLAGLGFSLYFAPDVWLSGRIKNRHRLISRQLLSFVDILAICSDAGLNLSEAIKRTVEFMPGVLGDEFRRFYRETETGASRSEALSALAARNGLEELSNVMLAIIQAEKYGAPVAHVLREQAKLLRTNRRNKAQEMAQTASIKILLPVVVFDFVPLLIILLGPAAVNLGRTLGF